MSDIGVLLTSHAGHRIFWWDCLTSWQRIAQNNVPVILGLDDTELLWHHDLPRHIGLILTRQRLLLQKGERWQIRFGAQYLRALGCKYILKSAGDQKINGSLDPLIPELGVYDFLGSECQVPDGQPPGLGTQVFFAKLHSLLDVITEVESGKIEEGFVEHMYGKAIQKCRKTLITRPESWWKEKIGLVLLQKIWIEKTGNYYQSAWDEGSKFYDITEEEIAALPDVREAKHGKTE